MGKRLVRAKDKIRHSGIPFRVPGREELPARLDAVLYAIYAAFTEGWTDPGGVDVIRRDLAEEALFLSGLVAELLPAEPEALGLLALVLHAEARRGARRSPAGEFVPLAQQDPALWNAQQIAHAETLLRRASALGAFGRFQLEAAIQSAMSIAAAPDEKLGRVLELYDALLALAGSPVIAINRALAVAEVQGAAAGLKRIARSVSRQPARPISALLGYPRRAFGQGRSLRGSSPFLRDRHRTGARSRGLPLPRSAEVRAARSP